MKFISKYAATFVFFVILIGLFYKAIWPILNMNADLFAVGDCIINKSDKNVEAWEVQPRYVYRIHEVGKNKYRLWSFSQNNFEWITSLTSKYHINQNFEKTNCPRD